MALKDQIKDAILNHPLMQYVVTFEVTTDGISDDDSSGENPDDNTSGDGGTTEEVVFDETDTNLTYFAHAVNEENKTVEVTTIDYDAWYAANGNYDVVIPEKLGNYTTVLISE